MRWYRCVGQDNRTPSLDRNTYRCTPGDTHRSHRHRARDRLDCFVRSGSLIRIDRFYVTFSLQMLQTWSQTIQNTHIWCFLGSCMQRRPLTLEKLSRTHKQAKMIENPLILSKFLSDQLTFLSLISSETIDSMVNPRTVSRTVFSSLSNRRMVRTLRFDFSLSLVQKPWFVQFWWMFHPYHFVP